MIAELAATSEGAIVFIGRLSGLGTMLPSPSGSGEEFFPGPATHGSIRSQIRSGPERAGCLPGERDGQDRPVLAAGLQVFAEHRAAASRELQGAASGPPSLERARVSGRPQAGGAEFPV